MKIWKLLKEELKQKKRHLKKLIVLSLVGVCVSGCITRHSDIACIDPIEYTDDDLEKLENAFKTIDKFFIDYGNQREKRRKLNENAFDPLP